MGKESFKNIWPLLEALAGDGNIYHDALMEVGKMNALQMSDTVEEAKKALKFLETYEEPKLPFGDVTEEQIKEEFSRLEEKYGLVVWSNLLAGTDEDCAYRVRQDPDYFLGMSEDDVRRLSMDDYAEDREYIRQELEKVSVNGVLCTGTIGRWDGPQAREFLLGSLSDVFSVFRGDDNTLYVKDGQLRAENGHHDGVDRFTFYTFREGFVPEDYSTGRDDVLESIVPALDSHFGWGITGKDGK